MQYKTLLYNNGSSRINTLSAEQQSQYRHIHQYLTKNRKILYRGRTYEKFAKPLVEDDDLAKLLEKFFLYGEKSYSFLLSNSRTITKDITPQEMEEIYLQLYELANHILDMTTEQTKEYHENIKFWNTDFRAFLSWFSNKNNKQKFFNILDRQQDKFSIILYYYVVFHRLDADLSINFFSSTQNLNKKFPFVSTTTSRKVARIFSDEEVIINIIRPPITSTSKRALQLIKKLKLPAYHDEWIFPHEKEVSLIYGVPVSHIISVDIKQCNDDTRVRYVNPNFFLAKNQKLLLEQGLNYFSKNGLDIRQDTFNIEETGYHGYFYSESLDIIRDSKIGESL